MMPFPGPGLSNSDQVHSLLHNGYGMPLNGCWMFISSLLQDIQDFNFQSHVFKGLSRPTDIRWVSADRDILICTEVNPGVWIGQLGRSRLSPAATERSHTAADISGTWG